MNNTVEFDTSKMIDAASNIQKMTTEVTTLINKMYKLFDDMTKEAWTGKNSNDYTNTVYLDKEEYIDYIDSIKEIAKELEVLSEKTESLIKTCEKEAERI